VLYNVSKKKENESSKGSDFNKFVIKHNCDTSNLIFSIFMIAKQKKEEIKKKHQRSIKRFFEGSCAPTNPYLQLLMSNKVHPIKGTAVVYTTPIQRH
jgi:hypothetical protein